MQFLSDVPDVLVLTFVLRYHQLSHHDITPPTFSHQLKHQHTHTHTPRINHTISTYLDDELIAEVKITTKIRSLHVKRITKRTYFFHRTRLENTEVAGGTTV